MICHNSLLPHLCETRQMGFGKVLHHITRAFEKMEVIVKVLNKKENNLFKPETLNFLSASVHVCIHKYLFDPV